MVEERAFVRRFDTARVLICTVALFWIWNSPAFAQSVLNFPNIGYTGSNRTGVNIANPTNRFADVQYTLYGPDGAVDSGRPVNPVRYRIPPHSQLSLFADEIFAGGRVQGGIQVTSSESNLAGNCVSGLSDFARNDTPSPSRGGDLAPTQFDAIVPAYRPDQVSLHSKPSLKAPDVGTTTGNPTVTLTLLPASTGLLAVSTGIPVTTSETLRTVQGRAFYEKMNVTEQGLDLNHPVMVPIRNARVEVIDPATNGIISVSQTDAFGRFKVDAPVQSDSTVRVLTRLRASNKLVLDNTNGNSLYAATSNLRAQDTAPVIIARDATRVSGAFNILEMLQEGDDLLRNTDPNLVLPGALPDATVLWSPANSPLPNGPKEELGSTYFDAASNTISLVGDRMVDSDEFDDSVILHEYGHLLAAAFSHDSSPGGVHILGDALDPRLAWSEGWANFFSSAARNFPLYLDSYGPNGTYVLRYDLREDVPQGDNPGYWSEFSVHSILWDLFGDKSDDSDSIEQPFRDVWSAFTDLKQDHFVYFPYFLEHYVADNPALTTAVTALAQSRSIDFQPGMQPSVLPPFPQPIVVGQSVTGTVDSLSTQRKDLLHSSDFLSFQAPAGLVSVRMDNTGLGPGNNPNANDLDLYLYDLNGQLIGLSNRGLNGDGQLIEEAVPGGTYVVEVRSDYDYLDGGIVKTMYNSGTYQVIVRTQ
jgi:hypothetical protein